VDLRAIPVVLPLARLIAVIDSYLSGGIHGMVDNDYTELSRKAEQIREKLESVSESVSSASPSAEPEYYDVE